MVFPHENQSVMKPDTTAATNRPANSSLYQPPPHQMRSDYMNPPNMTEYHNSQRHPSHTNQGGEVPSYHVKPNFTGQSKNGNFHQYYRQEDTRYSPQVNQQIVERRTDVQPAEDSRKSNDNIQYTFPSRDGPSPGRNYNYGMPQQEVQNLNVRMAEPNKTLSQPFRTNVPGSSRGKRKEHPSTPDGPRLISNQSSDDSINALLPYKQPCRRGSFFQSESASFLKSFTLSPLNSRTFSRDEPVDMPRFADSRGSAEGSRIFHSWSSGNSRSENHSPSDVRNCYVDWHSMPVSGRRGGTNVMNSRPGDNGSRIGEGGGPPSQIQARYDSRNHGAPPHNWQGPTHSREQMQAPDQTSNNFDMQKIDRTFNTNSRQLQPLHPEDRYNEQLLQGYSQGMDMGRPYWNNQGPVVPNLYTSQRRDDIEDRSNNQMVRGHPAMSHHQPSRVSAPTNPAANAWGRYGNDYHPGVYDPHGPGRNSHSSYGSWGQSSMRGRPFDGSFVQNAPPKDNGAPSYSDRLMHLKSVTVESGASGSTAMKTADGILLLSLPEDRISLSETLCIVRENVEVFIATETDVKAPAPGRKRPVVEGQVGLRCIHCRAAVHQSEKVKRAVCFPSSIKRIYRTVIDMKLDHFKACRFVPIELKLKLEELRATNARSTGTTMQYFVQAAKRMGMVDGGHGIRFVQPVPKGEPSSQPSPQGTPPQQHTQQPPNTASIMRRSPNKSGQQQNGVQSGVSFTLSLDLSISGESNGDPSKAKGSQNSRDTSVGSTKKDEYFSGKMSLSLPEDKAALSPLRCFLRENVCAFSATSEDIAVRTPTTFSVVLGQVGIGCIHCLSLPARERSNRAVCFPFNIERIYQSVADIQRFHLGECKMVPPAVRSKFQKLQSASSKGSKGLATRQYWVSSAKKLGLLNSDSGIRFVRDPSVPIEKAKSLDILAQVASDVTTAAQPLVLPEDKPLIAGFLYVVMKQLQPCRFTEADRNKRRLKDVGCIGVECRHCAGQVDGRKFFWSSVNAVESNFVSVHTHMMECKMISQDLKGEMAHLKTLRKEQTTRLKSGSQKSFFSRVWKRLHSEGNKIPSKATDTNQNQNPVQNTRPGPIGSPGKVPYTTPPSIVSVSHSMPPPSSPPVSDMNPFQPVSSPTSSLNFSVKKEDQVSPTISRNSLESGSSIAPIFPSPMSTVQTDGVAPTHAKFPSPSMSPYEPSSTMINSITPLNNKPQVKKEYGNASDGQRI